MTEHVVHLICAECGTFSEGEPRAGMCTRPVALKARKTRIRSWAPSALSARSASSAKPLRAKDLDTSSSARSAGRTREEII
jgi:hypothetical protein